ncbi:MAG: hypothetical protein Q9187_004633 [Circinaria calcarea]
MLTYSKVWSWLACAATIVAGQTPNIDDNCPGYLASNVVTTGSTLTADLRLAGPACNVFGTDLTDLKLLVEYQTDTRLHVQISDVKHQIYQVPISVVNRPASTTQSTAATAALEFVVINKPFSFAVKRKGTNEVLFDTSGTALIFESQYLRLRTSLPTNPNLYGLGEDTDPFRRNTTDYIRTLWSRDSYLIPPGTNLYGNHPVYFEHRETTKETHGVFLLNSNGMDIKINNTPETGQYLEYNIIGGILDFYFLTGPSPVAVAQQYSQVVGLPVMMPYWSLGYHHCRYGMRDVYEVADVVFNYSAANIPLETMWTDIDYMDRRKVFTLDPERFPLSKVRELVDHLHNNNQQYIVMVDPAVAYQNYSAFNNGVSAGAFLKNNDGSIFQGVVWPGITAFPDWFAPVTQEYWNNEFSTFFSRENGIDIDGLWIDMNEPSNFCPYPCRDPAGFAVANNNPPTPPPVRASNPQSLPGWPADFQPSGTGRKIRRQIANGDMKGLPGRDLINPPYLIHNAAGSISNHTVSTDVIHSNGLSEYDAHNLYGTMMSSSSRDAMINRRPGLRPLVITRSTFAGAGTKVGKWLGDNTASWDHYRISISGAISFAALYQVPMVGADACGFAGNTTETLCARWATLGAFMPFYRNHASIDVIPHEFYRWPVVAAAARNAIKARYQLLDYIYTAFHQQSVDGTPLLNPMFFLYPQDVNTFGISLQYFYGSSLLISPVTNENVTDVTIYLPNDQFYDFFTYTPVRGKGTTVTLTGIDYTQIPVHIKGGSILPIRVSGANTTTALRMLDFNLIVAPGLDGKASGSLYLDDGISIIQPATSEIQFAYDGSTLSMTGTFDFNAGSVRITNAILLGATGSEKSHGTYNATTQTLTYKVDASLSKGFEMKLK